MMAERDCCPDTDLIVFGHVTCEQAQPVRPEWVIQPSSAPPERTQQQLAAAREILETRAARTAEPRPPCRRRLLGRITR